MGAFRAHAGLWGWGASAPQGQLMVMSPSVRNLPSSPHEGLKKMHQETKVKESQNGSLRFIYS